MRIAQEEIFGPTVSVIEVGSLEEALEAINSVDYGLTSSIYTSSIRSAWKGAEKIQAGLTYVNASTIGSEAHLPFGGVKGSGNGAREGGIHGIDEFTDVKTVYFDYSGRLQRAQIEPYLEGKD
jgi:aldehyde dehydrogenase (NAD+)